MNKTIMSVHLPKAGGSSMRVSLAQQFGNRALFDYGRGPLGPQAHVIEPLVPPGIELVHGHFRPVRWAGAAPDAYWFTFLRHPVDLLLSFYFFWRTMPYEGLPLHRRFLDEQPDIESFAAWPPIQRLSSETFFGGQDMERFDFIGFHETRAVDMPRLNAAAGLRLESGRHENQTNSGHDERAAIKADAGTMGRLNDILHDDVTFYDRVRERRSS